MLWSRYGLPFAVLLVNAYCQAKEMHALWHLEYQPMIGQCVFLHELHARHAG